MSSLVTVMKSRLAAKGLHVPIVEPLKAAARGRFLLNVDCQPILCSYANVQ